MHIDLLKPCSIHMLPSNLSRVYYWAVDIMWVNDEFVSEIRLKKGVFG